jgi:hypothetical protein
MHLCCNLAEFVLRSGRSECISWQRGLPGQHHGNCGSTLGKFLARNHKAFL